MRQIFITLPLIFSALLTICITGCTPEVAEPNKASSEDNVHTNARLQKNNDSSVSHGNVAPMTQANCPDGRLRVYHTTWEAQDQFQPATGKSIGVMWDDLTNNQNQFSQYGCRMVVVNDPNSIPQLQANGFTLENIFIGLGPSGWMECVDKASSLGVHHFYIDEPIGNHREALVSSAANYIRSAGGDLTISECEFGWSAWLRNHGDIGAMIDLALTVQPHPYVSCHTHFYKTPLFTIDPRDQWSYIRSRVPDLFKMVIIKSWESSNNLGVLFGHADKLGIKKIFFYPRDTNGGYVGIQNAIRTGHAYQWVLQYAKQVSEEWCCPTIEWNSSQCSFDTKSYTGVDSLF